MPAKNVNRRLDDLRRCAEKRLGQQDHPQYLSEALEIAQELRVHQVELELQNEELQSTQAALSQAHDLYQKLFHLAPVGFVRLDLQHIIIDANEAAARLLGSRTQKLEGMPLLSKIDLNSLEQFQRHFIKASTSADGARDEIRLTVESRTVQMHTTALDRGRGRSRELLTAMVDVSEQKRYERELRRNQHELAGLNRELEERVAGRTAELEAQTVRLQEANVALKVLLDNRECERIAMQEGILASLNLLVMPILGRLSQSGTPQVQKSLIQALESHLKDLTSGFTPRLTSSEYKLSARELEVAGFIKAGKTSDEIAVLLGISPSSVIFHRNNIRHKLGLKGKKERLVNHLRSLS